eukprot:355226-Chlamydomonas_euryale.AAC.3
MQQDPHNRIHTDETLATRFAEQQYTTGTRQHAEHACGRRCGTVRPPCAACMAAHARIGDACTP